MDEEEIAISNTEKSEQPLASDCEQNSGMIHVSLTKFVATIIDISNLSFTLYR
jgi:hypothetical protein